MKSILPHSSPHPMCQLSHLPSIYHRLTTYEEAHRNTLQNKGVGWAAAPVLPPNLPRRIRCRHRQQNDVDVGGFRRREPVDARRHVVAQARSFLSCYAKIWVQFFFFFQYGKANFFADMIDWRETRVSALCLWNFFSEACVCFPLVHSGYSGTIHPFYFNHFLFFLPTSVCEIGTAWQKVWWMGERNWAGTRNREMGIMSVSKIKFKI